MVDLSICIVNWNTEAQLKECLQSIYEHTEGIAYEIFVVDNASRDGSVEMVRTHFPDVCLIVNRGNRGFAAANNQAIRLAKGRHVIFLNPDTVINGNALATMVRFMEGHPETGAIGCKLLNADGSVQHSIRRFPTFSIALHDNTILGRLFLFRGRVEDYKMKDFSFDRVEEVDATSGAALLVRRDVLDEVGPLDEGYFMFIEELDFCQRIRARGHKIYFIPDAAITHLGGESRRQNPGELVIVGQNSLMRYFTKFEGPKKTFLFKILYKPLFMVGILYDLIFDSLSLLKYKTIRKDPSKSKRREMKIKGTFHFLRRDLGYFIFKL
jgi:N-acetylglucosaminyl-diphospho-decaprenol L-rhamnosyltransferase